MKTGLFILSVLGFVAAAYGLSIEMSANYSDNHLIILFLLGILLCNCGLGIIMTFPQLSFSKRRLKIAPGRYAIRK